MEQLDILGIKVTSATVAEINDAIDRIIASGKPGVILSANVYAVNLARRRPWLADFFKQADIVHVDGAGIIKGARLLGRDIAERITWADWVWPLSRHLADKGYRLFMLGGEKGVTDQAAEKLTAAVPGLQVAGTHHGYFPKQGPGNQEVIDKINQSGADVLWIGMGMPLQERWLMENQAALNVKLHMICGAAYKHMAGLLTRSPQWFIDHDMEWFWLLLQDPRRGAVRYLWGNPVFMFYVLLEKWGLR